MNNILNVIPQILLGAFIGIIIGMLIDWLMPTPHVDESYLKLISLIILQLLISGIVVWVVLIIANKYKTFDSTTREGITGWIVFTTTIFISQTSLIERISILKTKIKNT